MTLRALHKPAADAASTASKLDIATRLRRNRKSEWSRRLVRETVLTTNDLIWPIFLVDGSEPRTPVATMPGVDRVSIDEAVREAEKAPGSASPPSPPSPMSTRPCAIPSAPRRRTSAT
jgi:porphobilinogen synthase